MFQAIIIYKFNCIYSYLLLSRDETIPRRWADLGLVVEFLVWRIARHLHAVLLSDPINRITHPMKHHRDQ